MSIEKSTLRLRQRLVSFDGGEHFKPAFASTPQELTRHWSDLLAAMDGDTRCRAERSAPAEDRLGFLATYLAIAPSHLIVGGQ